MLTFLGCSNIQGDNTFQVPRIVPDVFSYGDEDDYNAVMDEDKEGVKLHKEADFYGQSQKWNNHWYLETTASTFSRWNRLFQKHSEHTWTSNISKIWF